MSKKRYKELKEQPEWEDYTVKHICKVCGGEIPHNELRKHRLDHILKGDVWSAPCKLAEDTLRCLNKEQVR